MTLNVMDKPFCSVTAYFCMSLVVCLQQSIVQYYLISAANRHLTLKWWRWENRYFDLCLGKFIVPTRKLIKIIRPTACRQNDYSFACTQIAIILACCMLSVWKRYTMGMGLHPGNSDSIIRLNGPVGYTTCLPEFLLIILLQYMQHARWE